MCKIYLKDAYFAVLLSQSSRKYVRYQCKGLLYKFLCLCFGLSSTPKVFTELMKVLISLLRKPCINITIYPGDMLLMIVPPEELLIA